MTTREPPRLALALLERLAPGGSFLAGDLIEEYRRRPSRWRVWREVLAAIATRRPHDHDEEIRPLHLVDLQPTDAIDRTRDTFLRPRQVNLSASPLAGAGGITIVVLALVATLFMPGVWWLLAAAFVAGIGLGVVLIALRRGAIR
jgi:hypothetical protein